MTRAEQILRQIDEVVPLVLAGTALGAANLANAVYQAKKKRDEKVQQAGLGAQHQAAKKELFATRRKQVTRLGLSSRLSQQAQGQKARVKDIENKGLERFHKGLAQNPAQHQEVKRQEMTT